MFHSRSWDRPGFRGAGGLLHRAPATRCRTILPLLSAIDTQTSVSRSTSKEMTLFAPDFFRAGLRVNFATASGGLLYMAILGWRGVHPSLARMSSKRGMRSKSLLSQDKP